MALFFVKTDSGKKDCGESRGRRARFMCFYGDRLNGLFRSVSVSRQKSVITFSSPLEKRADRSDPSEGIHRASIVHKIQSYDIGMSRDCSQFVYYRLSYFGFGWHFHATVFIDEIPCAKTCRMGLGLTPFSTGCQQRLRRLMSVIEFPVSLW